MSKSKQEIWKVLAVLFASVFAAVLVTAFFVLNYGPSGSISLTSALIAPDVLKELNYNDYNPKIATNDRFVFDQILLNNKVITPSIYAKIYALLEGDQSIRGDHEEIEGGVKLVIFVRTESPSAWQKAIKVFQEVEFSKSGNLYKVSLHEESKGNQFAYFYHEGITEEILRLIP